MKEGRPKPPGSEAIFSDFPYKPYILKFNARLHGINRINGTINLTIPRIMKKRIANPTIKSIIPPAPGNLLSKVKIAMTAKSRTSSTIISNALPRLEYVLSRSRCALLFLFSIVYHVHIGSSANKLYPQWYTVSSFHYRISSTFLPLSHLCCFVLFPVKGT